ncbi:MAG: SDR family oxidoreductase [Bacteroidetes bacterium]|nr:SDR family oxidoreductase [Bacteroidota bacterium]
MKGKTVIVTGASSGIGMACAEVFAAHGCRVILSARQKDKLDNIVIRLKKQGHDVAAFTADVSKEEDCRNLIDETIKQFGQIDVLICNAGISMRAIFEDVDLNVIRKVMDVNFWGTVYCAKYALPHLLRSKGSVVGISSIAGKKGLPGRTGYSASKFAMEGFLETLRTENLKKDLHVLVACPGFTASNIRNMALAKDGSTQGESPRDEQNMMSAEVVANHIYSAVKNRKRDLVLTLNGKMAVLLNKFFPGLMDKVVYNHMAKEKDSPLK